MTPGDDPGANHTRMTPIDDPGANGAGTAPHEAGERSGAEGASPGRDPADDARLRRLWFLIPLAAFFALAAVLAVGLKRDPREVPSPLIDKPAPDFALTRLDDPARTIRLADLRGKVWVLNVWASWCVACREEHPVLVEFAKQHAVPLYGLNYKDKRPDATAWLQRFGNPYDASLFDGEGRVGIDFGVYGVPETFVIDGNGVIRMKHIGPLTAEVIATRILPLVRKLDA